MPVWHEFYKYMTQEAPPPLVLIVVLGIALLVMGVFVLFMWFFSRLAARMVVRQIFGKGEHDLESIPVSYTHLVLAVRLVVGEQDFADPSLLLGAQEREGRLHRPPHVQEVEEEVRLRG